MDGAQVHKMKNSTSTQSGAFTFESVFTYNSGVDEMKYKSRNCYKSAFGYTYQSIPFNSEFETAENSDETSCFLRISRFAIICCSYLVLIALFPLSLLKCLKRVHALERLVILRLGKLLPVVGPGYHIILPFIDICSRVNLKPKVFHVPLQQVLIADGAIVEVLASIKYCISHAVHYVTRLKSQERAIHELLQRCLANLVSEKEQSDLQQNRVIISSSVKSELNNTLLVWGVEILDIVMPPVKILKEAEPVNVLGQVINAFKGAAFSGCNALQVPGFSESNIETEKCSTDRPKTLNEALDNSYLTRLKDLLQIASQKNIFCGHSAIYKLQILGNVDKILYVQVVNGNATLCENVDLCENVTIILTEEDICEFIASKISPVRAYMDGRIQVLGDVSLLKYLFQALSL